ncbi:DNA cytosine methyltransferase [Acinetobacter ursingii]|uniref:DNA cytosine methyltransferase n=1 Tax=Acinetobacter ursingii TaxID=108980 RepID=UPI001250B4F2|nr:DNA (cytosine-5-)-methyltransferase [Acinetobacter ursingii]
MNHIELFAGCGGLSLGLESAGFKLVMANELSPMAAETFAYNFFNENLEESCAESRVIWLSSNYEKENRKARLREDPRKYPELNENKSDFSQDTELNEKLVVGNIVQLNQWLEHNPKHAMDLRNAYGREGGLDLVSGGPPCQSFSMAGLRQFNNTRNTLPWEFAKFVQTTQPKIALLENVTGILRAFDVDGKKFYAWFEVAKAFAQINYIPLCLHINAKYAGVPQNRPRFIFIGVRHDVFDNIYIKLNETEKKLYKHSISFVNDLKKGLNVEYGALPYFDVAYEEHQDLFRNTFLSPLIRNKDNEFTVKDAIDDLRGHGLEKSQYIELINTSLMQDHRKNESIMNHDLRNNGIHVQRRFRIYQILQLLDSSAKKEALDLLKGKIDTVSAPTAKSLLSYDYLSDLNKYIKFSSIDELISYFNDHQTKKQTQKALIADQPAPAALSIPDDACHYHHDELRTLTVREMARIQSFPDQFVFRSKVTTGGQMRQFEVPQYTQVGNAVPPLLGQALGRVIKGILEKYSAICQESRKSPA